MGLPIEGAPRINYLKGGGKTVAEPSPLAMRRQLEQYLDTAPVVDKDRVDEEIAAVRQKLGSETESLTRRALSGNPWEVARAHSEIEELLEPRPPLTTQRQPFRVGMTVQGLTLSDRKPRIIPEKGIIARALGKAVSLYKHVASSEVSGLKTADVNALINELREGDRERQLRTSREVLKITAPIEERTKKR